jgi:hypothetical protein
MSLWRSEQWSAKVPFLRSNQLATWPLERKLAKAVPPRYLRPFPANFGLRIRNSTNDRSGAITPLVEIAAITSDGSMQTLLGRQPRIPSASTKSSRSAVWRIQGKGDLHLCSGSAVWRE